MAYFTTKQRMIDFLSHRGVTMFSDHDEEGVPNDDVIDECREMATQEILGNLYSIYSETALATSGLITGWATIMACYYLCLTRGNAAPDGLAAEYERLTAIPNGLLERARKGLFSIPGIAKLSTNIPTFSNLRIDRRYQNEKIRVVLPISSPIPSTIEQDAAPIRWGASE